MKKKILLSTLIIFSIVCTLNAATLLSPNKNLKLEFQLTPSGEPEYSFFYREKAVILPSKMGFELKNMPSFVNGFQIHKIDTLTFDQTWEPIWGEVRQIRNHYNEMLVCLEQKSTQRTMKIRFRLFDDGLGFRYEFDKQQNLSYFQIMEEFTQFALTADHKAFWIPGDYDTNEYYYTTTKLSEVDASKVDGSGIGTHGYFAKNAVQSP
nr:glycoside hydrolase family 97 N-terminal domain-containing protein [Paludibacteraceae bacterium]